MEAPAFLPDVAHDHGVEIPLLPQPLADLIDRLRHPVLLEIGPGRWDVRASRRRRRGGLDATEPDGVDEDLPDEVEVELEPLLALLRDPDVGEEAGTEDLLDGLVDEPRREGVARAERDEVEEPRFARTAVDPDGDAVDDRGLLSGEGPRAGPGQDDGEGQDGGGASGAFGPI